MDVQWGKMVSRISQVRQAAAEGFQFVQAAGELAENLGDAQAVGPRAGGLPFRVCSVPLPADVQVTQRGFNLYVWTEHLKRAVQRLAELGCSKLVWSDGRARVLPVEGEVSGLKEQVLQFLFMLCEVAASFGLAVLVEPLGPRRTNLLNSMKETSEFLSRVGKENLSSMISLRELEPIGLSLSELAAYGKLIEHVQMENPLPAGEAGGARSSRICPRPGDGYDYRLFLQALRQAGYSGGISLPDDADAAGLAYCRNLWGE
jgi:sugar phosphate isomerase/epimerase